MIKLQNNFTSKYEKILDIIKQMTEKDKTRHKKKLKFVSCTASISAPLFNIYLCVSIFFVLLRRKNDKKIMPTLTNIFSTHCYILMPTA